MYSEEPSPKSPTSPSEDKKTVQKFHVLALARIEETGVDNNESGGDGGGVGLHRHGGDCPGAVGRRPSIKVDNWDFIYTEKGPEAQVSNLWSYILSVKIVCEILTSI